MFFEHLIVNLRLIIKTVYERHRIELDEVFIPRLVLCEEYEVFGYVGRLVVHILGYVKFTADYVFYARGGRLFGKVQRAVHISVVGHTHGVYRVFLAIINKVVYFARAVQKRILRMQVQMYEICHLFPRKIVLK